MRLLYLYYLQCCSTESKKLNSLICEIMSNRVEVCVMCVAACGAIAGLVQKVDDREFTERIAHRTLNILMYTGVSVGMFVMLPVLVPAVIMDLLSSRN